MYIQLYSHNRWPRLLVGSLRRISQWDLTTVRGINARFMARRMYQMGGSRVVGAEVLM